MIHLKIALQNYGEYIGPEQLLGKMKNVWQLYEQNKIEEPQLKENKNVVKAYLCRNINIQGGAISMLKDAHTLAKFTGRT